ncbi:hypothetical protein, partial [Actinomadura roseirufa]|uniref:hypothetical protein n=1 Tax=Actinomadura roseirufa TaxID=2094049 RepID=UPI001A95583A
SKGTLSVAHRNPEEFGGRGLGSEVQGLQPSGRGRSIAGYKRHELVEIVARVAAYEADLTDDQIVELAGRLLGCPEDEALLVGARLRYAVEIFRETAAES